MKKNNHSKGFMLVETLIVSTFITGTLVFLFIQFRTINQGYDISFKYNTINGLYAADNVKKYLLSNGIQILSPAIEKASKKYIDLTDCTDLYLTETNYCSALLPELNIKKIIITKNDLSTLIPLLDQDNSLEEEFKQFIRYIVYDKDALNHRLIIQFKDDTYATITISENEF